MKQTKLFNNISEELRKQIPKLKPNEVVVFQMLNGVPNPEPDEKERKRQGEIIYPKVQVLTNFRIYDEYKGEYVDMVLADGWIGDNPAKHRTFVPGNEKGRSASRFQGKFQVTGGVVRDEELYEILWLSPQRKGTPCPDESVEQIFEILDLKAGNQNKLNKFDQLSKVIEITKSLKPAEARRIMRALNQPEYQDDATLLAMVKDFATKNVDVFLQTYENKDTYLKSDIIEAVNSKVIEHDLPTGDVKLSGTVICNIKVSTPDAFADAFVRWVNTSENGKDVLANIKAQMNKAKA